MDAWVDFNFIPVRDGITTTLRKYVKKDIPLTSGTHLTVGDFDGNYCEATVLDVFDEIVKLQLNLDTWKAAS